MTTYLDLLPDDLYIKIYEDVNRSTLKDAAKIGLRRQIPKIGKKTNHNAIWHWMNNNPFESLSPIIFIIDLCCWSWVVSVAEGGSFTVGESQLVGADGGSDPFPCDGKLPTCAGAHDGSVVVERTGREDLFVCERRRDSRDVGSRHSR
eukprot:SAG22_NODE_194_length_15610_cov_1280.270776_3_plen_148_part_00